MPMSDQRLCPDDLTVGLSELSAAISERDECDEQRTIWTPRRSTRCSAIPDQRDFRARSVVEIFITSNLKLTYYDPFDSPSFRSCLLMISIYIIPSVFTCGLAIPSGNPVRFEDQLFIHIGMSIGMMGSGVDSHRAQFLSHNKQSLNFHCCYHLETVRLKINLMMRTIWSVFFLTS